MSSLEPLDPNALIIRQALAKNVKATYRIDGHEGLYLQTRADGTGSWVLRYRVAGKQREKTLHDDAGRAKFADIAKAKDEWRTAAKVHGRDIQAERDAEAVAKRKAEQEDRDTFDRLFTDWLGRHAKVRKKSWADDERLYNRHVKSRLADKKAVAIKRTDVVAVLDDIAAKVSPIQANRCQAIISVVFSWAVNEGRLETTPAYRIPKRGKESVRERALTDDEIRQLWAASIDAGPAGDATRFALVTGQRRAEVAEMPRVELDLSEHDPAWTIPSARTKNKIIHRVPLSPMAVAILEAQPVGSKVFAGRPHSGTGTVSPNALSRFVARLDIGEPRATFHDLRRTVGTRMAQMGVPKDIRAKVLNHVTGARSSVTDAVYNQYDGDAEKRRALQLWADRLAEIVADRPSSGLRWVA